MSTATYQTIIIKFIEPIAVLDGTFEDAQSWGVSTLKGWIENYESSRMTVMDEYTAVVTSEYNMSNVKAWLERYTSIAEITEY